MVVVVVGVVTVTGIKVVIVMVMVIVLVVVVVVVVVVKKVVVVVVAVAAVVIAVVVEGVVEVVMVVVQAVVEVVVIVAAVVKLIVAVVVAAAGRRRRECSTRGSIGMRTGQQGGAIEQSKSDSGARPWRHMACWNRRLSCPSAPCSQRSSGVLAAARGTTRCRQCAHSLCRCRRLLSMAGSALTSGRETAAAWSRSWSKLTYY